MKISSYNMAQQATHTYYKHEMTSFKSELVKVRDIKNQNQIFNDVPAVVESRKTDLEERKAKNELIDSLMAYLDRRPFKFNEIPCVKEDTGVETDSKDTKVLSVNISDRNSKVVGIKNTVESEIYEKESLHFTSLGQLMTSDGQSLEFSYDVEMHREFYEENSTAVTRGFLDPLILNLDRKGVDFDEKKIHIDLDMDGEIDSFNMLSQGNGFLVLDKNNNGTVDNGSELFGPETNDGFEELRAYDQDGNNWIDENDVIFKDLKVWLLDDDGKETLISIKEADIGAIYLGDAKGNFDIKDGQETVAKITSSSIFLFEDGSTGGVHEIML